MNQSPTRSKTRARSRGDISTNTKKIDRKRKAKPSITTEENCKNRKTADKLLYCQKEMKLESDEVIECVSADENNCIVENLSIENIIDKHKKISKHNIKQQKKKNICGFTRSMSRTPNELIKHMTSFTFSNYFTPISKDSSPLPKLNWGDHNEVWETMLQKDREYKRDALYIRKHPSLQPKMRAVLLDWLIEVCEVYKLHRETFYLASDYVDRYLSTQRNLPKSRLQLVGVTALFVAAKIEEIYPPKLAEFSYVTDGACTDEEIVQQEMLLLEALYWRLTPVTPFTWLTSYLQIANRRMSTIDKENIDDRFEFPQFSGIHLCRVAELMDLCCLDTGYLQFSYSIIAASSLYHMWGKDVTDITGHKFDELFPCIQWLAPFAKAINSQPVKPVKQFDKISAEDSHNIQIHSNGIILLDIVHSQMNTTSPIANIKRSSPIVQCKGILTPPKSTEKGFS